MGIKRTLVFSAGIALIVAGVAGLAFSVVGLVVLPRLERQVEAVAAEQLEVLDRALATTLEGLITAETALVQAAEAVEGLEGIMADVGLAINDTAPILDTAAELLGDQLPTTIRATQETLTSVATSAQLVDDILGVISVIPFLGTDRYNPDVPLHQGFRDVSDGLDGIPELLLAAGEGLSSGTESLEEIEEGFAAMGQSISGFKKAAIPRKERHASSTNPRTLSRPAITTTPVGCGGSPMGAKLAIRRIRSINSGSTSRSLKRRRLRRRVRRASS